MKPGGAFWKSGEGERTLEKECVCGLLELRHVCELAYIGAQSSKMVITPSGPALAVTEHALLRPLHHDAPS